MKKILVTGGAGFIGSNLVSKLQKDNYVTVIDRFSTGSKKNIYDFKGNLYKIDTSHDFDLDEKFDVIYHLASITDTISKDENEMLRNNIESFIRVLNLAIRNKAKLIYASSSYTYGNGKIPMVETQQPDILNAYARSKLTIDEITKQENRFSRVNIIGLKYFPVYGPREQEKGRATSMIYQIAKKLHDGETNIELFKQGEQTKDWIHVDDVVQANLNAMNAKPGIYNVGTGVTTDFNSLTNLISKVLNIPCTISYIDNPIAWVYQKNNQADTTFAEKELNFKCKYTLEERITQYMQYLGYIK